MKSFDKSNFKELTPEVELLPPIESLSEYPVEALGPKLGGVVRAISEGVQAPPVIAAHSVLSVSALVVQSLKNVSMDGRIYPTSLNLLSIAESGDRKTGCDNVAMKPVKDWHRKAQKKYSDDLKDYQLKKKGHQEEAKRIVSATKKSGADIAVSLGELDEPLAPIQPDIICQEPTLEGLQRSLKDGLPSQGLFNDEGGQFFGGYAMNPENCTKSIAGLSKIWDGSPIVRTRAATGESFTMYDRRLTVHLMAQPIVTARILSNPLLQQQGIMARFLVGVSQTLAGSRVYQSVDPYLMPPVLEYYERISNLLAVEMSTSEDGGLELSVVVCDEGAKEAWKAFYNEVELQQVVGGELELIRPVASKMAENVLRLAAVISTYNGEPNITEETMNGALILGEYYLKQALRIAQQADVTKDEQQCIKIVEWLKTQSMPVPIDDIQKYSPRPLGLRRSVSIVRDYMEILVDRGLVGVCSFDTRNNPSSWELLDV